MGFYTKNFRPSRSDFTLGNIQEVTANLLPYFLNNIFQVGNELIYIFDVIKTFYSVVTDVIYI